MFAGGNGLTKAISKTYLFGFEFDPSTRDV
jgi:hypothetical protein